MRWYTQEIRWYKKERKRAESRAPREGMDQSHWATSRRVSEARLHKNRGLRKKLARVGRDLDVWVVADTPYPCFRSRLPRWPHLMNIHREWQTGIKCIFLKLGVRTNVRARTTSSIMPAFVGTGMPRKWQTKSRLCRLRPRRPPPISSSFASANQSDLTFPISARP